MIPGGILIHLSAVNEGGLDEIVPGFLSLEKYILEIFLNALFSKAIKSTKFGKKIESFVPVFELLDTMHEIFCENLCHFLTPHPDQEPFDHELVERHQLILMTYNLVIKKNFIGGENINQTASYLFIEVKRSGNIG